MASSQTQQEERQEGSRGRREVEGGRDKSGGGRQRERGVSWQTLEDIHTLAGNQLNSAF